MQTRLKARGPLSPYLFILAVDVLTKSIHLATERGFIQRVGAFPPGCQQSSLQYADDTLILASPDERSVANLSTILSCFELLSGLSINSAKSAVYGLGSCTTNTACRASQILGCNLGAFPFVYLGIPLRHINMSRGDWQPLIDKFAYRLAGWKGNCLSRGGRLTLLNSVLTSLPLYYMSYFRLPQWVIQKIDQIRRGFLWKGAVYAHGSSSLISWETVCTPRDRGGWGFLTYRTLIPLFWLNGVGLCYKTLNHRGHLLRHLITMVGTEFGILPGMEPKDVHLSGGGY